MITSHTTNLIAFNVHHTHFNNLVILYVKKGFCLNPLNEFFSRIKVVDALIFESISSKKKKNQPHLWWVWNWLVFHYSNWTCCYTKTPTFRIINQFKSFFAEKTYPPKNSWRCIVLKYYLFVISIGISIGLYSLRICRVYRKIG